MAINIGKTEEELFKLKETVEGNASQLLISDKKIYCEVEKSALSLWFSALIFSIFQLFGLTSLFAMLIKAHRGSIIELKEIDSIDVVKKPKAIILALGVLVNIGLLFFLQMQYRQPSLTPLIISVVVNFIFAAALIVSRRACIIVYSKNNNFVYNSKQDMASLEKIRDLIFECKLAVQGEIEFSSIKFPAL